MSMTDSVILVHGIWAHGVTMVMMKYRLQKEYGFDVHLFNYPSVKGTLDENARRLSGFIRDLGLDETHVIGHSLGGVIALRMYAIDDDAVPGRIVCMGSPLTGSRAAEFLSTQNWAEPILGESLPAGVVPHYMPVSVPIEWAIREAASGGPPIVYQAKQLVYHAALLARAFTQQISSRSNPDSSERLRHRVMPANDAPTKSLLFRVSSPAGVPMNSVSFMYTIVHYPTLRGCSS